MPIINETAPGFSESPVLPPPVEDTTPTLEETFESGFRMENTIANGVEALSQPAFKADSLFSGRLGKALQDYDKENNTSFWDNYRDNFVGVQSEDEMLWLMGKIQQEEHDRDVLGRSGFMGFAAATAAGILDPTAFIPLVGAATKAKTAWQFAREAAMIGAGVGAGQEAVLSDNQVTRGWDEVAIGIGANTVLSGILGGAVGVMSRSELRAAEQSLKQSRIVVSSAGAAGTIAETSGTLASGAVQLSRVLDSNALTRSPVSFNIVQPKNPRVRSDVARGAMIQLSDGGYRLEGNDAGVPTAPGGTIENVVQTYYNIYPSVLRTLDDNFLDYRFDAAPPMVAPHWRASLADLANATNGKLTKSDFRSEVSKALRNNDEHHIPQVAATAKHIREGLLNPILREAQSVGILPENIDLKGDASWILRDYNRVEIARNTTKFVNTLAQYFQRKLTDQFAGELTNLKGAKAKRTELIEDLGRTPDEAAKLRESFLAQRKELDESEISQRYTDLEDSIDELRGQARALRGATASADVAKRRQLLRDARDMEKAAGVGYQELRKQRADISRRLNNLNRSAALLESRQQKKLEAVERIEELNMKALRRAAKAGQQTLRQLDTIADDKLDAEIQGMVSKMLTQRAAFAKGQERLEKNLADVDLATKVATAVLPEARATALVKKALGKTKVDEKEFASRVKNMQNSFPALVNSYRQFTPEDIATRLASAEGEELEALKFVQKEQKAFEKAGVVLERLPEQEARQAQRQLEIDELLKQIDEAENIDRAGARAIINHLLELTLEDINEVNMRRSFRYQRLVAQADALDPAQVGKRIDELNAKGAQRELDFADRWRLLGADDVDVAGGGADFARFAQETAVEAKNRIMGTYLRLPNVDAVRGPRGSEISRTLDIPSNLIEEFLNNDVESLMRQTLKTFPPDIELARRPEFGDINGQQMFVKLADERELRLQELDADATLSVEQKQAQSQEINKTFDQYARNLEAVIGRLRHTWGLPQDPEGMGYRLGKTVMNLNVLRLMGGVTISSIPDMARPIMRYGLLRTFRDGVMPMITNFKQFKATAREVKALAGGMDIALQSRASAMFDLIDDVGRGTKLEQGIEYATRRFGLLALFDYWTQGMKQFSGTVAHAKLMDSVDSVVNGTGNVKEATRFLAENGIDGGLAERIWGQMVTAGGANKVDGRWWPNTAEWTDAEVLRAYSAAITREVNTSIVTPGVEKPLWIDQNLTGRMLGQFKSFAFASTSKMLGAGMQQRDAAFLNGVMFSLALGMGGYYLYAMAAGGKAKETMLNAGPEKWVDEAIARSGLLGIFAEVQGIAERIPATAPYATFSGTRSARRGGDNLTEFFLGPSFDFATQASSVIGGIHDPDQSTVHQLRTLAPGQNISYLRWLFNQAEQAVPVRDRSAQ